MPTLLLARHAKSSWADGSLRDHDRPLNRRGADDAPRVGSALRARDLIPDLVYSSTSARTRETLAGLEDGFEMPLQVHYVPELYLASPGTMLAAVQSAPDEVETLMILAHNPGTHALAVGLAADGNRKDLEQMRLKFPTGAVAVLNFDLDRWADIQGGGTLVEFILPRSLP
ncbi:MAG: histidine phosphatase family protein [Gemmatimonadota bacterium]|nr:histidine phosphatase family protein [Gemmatimonadota bacterium]